MKSFVSGLRPEIREHVIFQQPPDFESALNIAKLKELVPLSLINRIMVKKSRILKNYSLTPQKRKSNNLSGTNLMFGVQISKVMEIIVFIANFDFGKLNHFRYGGSVFSKNPKFGSYGSSKANFRGLYRRNNMQNAFHQGKIGAQLNWLAPLSCVVVNP